MIYYMINFTKIVKSAVQILYEVVEAYHGRNVKVYFVRLKERPLGLFKLSGLYDLVGPNNFFRKVSDAIEVIEKDMMNHNMTVSL